MINNRDKGQSLVELVFAIGLVGLVMSGAVALAVSSLASQSNKFDHKKAAEMAAMVVEDLVDQKENHPDTFWYNPPVVVGQTKPEYPDDYHYSTTFVQAPASMGGKCATPNNCATMTVTVTWHNDPTKAVTVSRFFGRN